MKIKDKIIELRKLGYSYRKIVEETGCSKGTVAYHCGKGQKEKHKFRIRKNRNFQHPLIRKIENFRLRPNKNKTKKDQDFRKLNRILYQKIQVFSGKHRKKGNYNAMDKFTIEDFLKKVGKNPKCNLTGRNIDLLEGRTYHLDHIIPRSKGGNNSLSNCQLVCRDANQAKGDLTMDEFVKLCKDVVDNHKASSRTRIRT